MESENEKNMKKKDIKKKNMKKKEKVMFFCAHNDDQIVGAGGTLAKYAEQGKDIVTVIFSYGEMSHPWYKPEHIIDVRIKEARNADKILGGKRLVFLDMQEGSFMKGMENKDVKKRIKDLIKEEKPSKIFTHSINDPMPDHKAVYNIMYSILKDIKFKGDVYMYEVWTPISLKRRNDPKMVVDITSTFRKKVNAFKVHKSQKAAIFSLLWSIYVKAILFGFNNGCRYAEVFQKMKI